MREGGLQEASAHAHSSPQCDADCHIVSKYRLSNTHQNGTEKEEADEALVLVSGGEVS